MNGAAASSEARRNASASGRDSVGTRCTRYRSMMTVAKYDGLDVSRRDWRASRVADTPVKGFVARIGCVRVGGQVHVGVGGGPFTRYLTVTLGRRSCKDYPPKWGCHVTNPLRRHFHIIILLHEMHQVNTTQDAVHSVAGMLSYLTDRGNELY